jgi:HAD superfamily hydrolase (TIGR01509 family)
MRSPHFPQGKYAAVIFDMDGVLADSEPVYYDAMNSVIRALGHEVTPELQRRLMGHSVQDTWRTIAEEFHLEGPLDGLIARYDSELCRQLALVKETLPGVSDLLSSLKSRRIPLGLASSSWPGWIDALLGGIGLQGQFDAVVSAKMVEHPKPAPDIYLFAAERLGVPPEGCIAIEDTPTGLASAKAAGMFTVQSRSASTAFPPQPNADLVLASLADFDLTLLIP